MISDDASEMNILQDLPITTEYQVIDEKKETQNSTPEVVNTFTLASLIKWLPKDMIKDGLMYEVIFESIDAIKDEEVKTTIEKYLLNGQIKEAQEYVGMKMNSRYQDNKADGKLDSRTLDRLTDDMFHLKGNEILNNKDIPDDVKEAYQKFENKEGLFDNSGLPYAIVSKDPTDYNLYLFDAENNLISRHKVLLGKTIGDTKNIAYENKSFTTPGGMYSVNVREFKPKEYAWPGEYVSLLPLEGQYDVSNKYSYTMGFHCYFKWRENFFNSLATRRQSFWCINLLPEGAPFDNLQRKTLPDDPTSGIGSKLYVTPEHQ